MKSMQPTSDGAARTINELPWKLLTILEVAVMLNLSPHTIRKFAAGGTLKPIEFAVARCSTRTRFLGW